MIALLLSSESLIVAFNRFIVRLYKKALLRLHHAHTDALNHRKKYDTHINEAYLKGQHGKTTKSIIT